MSESVAHTHSLGADPTQKPENLERLFVVRLTATALHGVSFLANDHHIDFLL